jgi:site-specific recombinase XerD
MEKHGIDNIRTVGRAELFAYYRYVCSQKLTTSSTVKSKLLSSKTINWRLLSVKKVFAVLYRSGYLTDDPMHGLELDIPTNRSFKRRPFTETEINMILDKIDTSTKIGLRDRTLFELIYSSGLRVSEASKLTIGDIDLERREIILHGKGSLDRMVPISVIARDYLLNYLSKRINYYEEPVFIASRKAGKPMGSKEISQRFNELLKKFGMEGPGRSTHAVRHSTATHLLDHGASIRHIQELLGHKNIENTVRYTQIQTGRLQKEYRKYHPAEHELFEIIDEAYCKRLENLIEKSKKNRK